MQTRRQAVALALAAVLSVASCGNDGSNSSTSAEQRCMPESAGSSAGTTIVSLPATPSLVLACSVESGVEYVSRRMSPLIRLTPDTGFYGFEMTGTLLLVRDPEHVLDSAAISITVASAIEAFRDPLLPTEAFSPPGVAENLTEFPSDVAGWLSTLPAVNAVPAGRKKIGQRQADVFDFSVAAVPSGLGPCTDRPCVALWGVGTAADDEQPVTAVLPGGHQGRFYVLKTMQETVIITAAAPKDRWRAFAPVAEATIQSITLD